MRYDIKALDVLFRCISPDLLWQKLNSHKVRIDADESRKLFMRFAGGRLREYSLDEHEKIYSYIQDRASRMEMEVPHKGAGRCNRALVSTALYSALVFANEVLTQRRQEPQCQIDHVQMWRDAFLLLGQDLFVCAFLAWEDAMAEWTRWNFAWPAVLRTDHPGLNEILNRGLCENHQHLYGSSQTFPLSWCNLMNDPRSHALIDQLFERRFQPFAVTGAQERLMTLRECVRNACVLRKRLFCWLKNIDDVMHDDGQSLIADRHLAQDLVALRYTYGAKVPQPDQTTACLDYALEDRVFQASKASHYRALAGERHLLYACYQKLVRGHMDEHMQLTFYLYLVLKGIFRSELIQVNDYRGFRNFSDYQDRKTLLCNKTCYWAELIRMGINAPLREGHVCSLETRITPKDSQKKYIHTVNENDRFCEYAEASTNHSGRGLFPALELRLPSSDREKLLDKYFYVVHFVKCPDQISKEAAVLDLNCRHAKLRKGVRRQAIELYNAIHSNPDFRKRIRGIDSASHEIGCPPEVFATAFRFLRKHIEPNKDERLLLNQTMTQLSLTYHAGEDFLDIAGALRAIDEAVEFLEFKRGDRIGHALGLGIEPEEHYKVKGRRVFIPKLDRLDDLVWLLHRATALGAQIQHQVLRNMEMEAWALFREIFGETVLEKGWHVGLQEYYYSMRLRADDPALYKSSLPDEHVLCRPMDSYDMYGESRRSSELEQYRKSKDIYGLYHLYHYGLREKQKGNEIYCLDIDSQYINMIRDVQEALQAEIARKGIIIECNPSSNVIIGTFSDYDRHPIFRFNNTGLERNLDRYNNCYQIQACINTDDLGVFDTSLEFEYALLFRAMKDVRLSDGTQYAEADILKYLDTVRLMGERAVFPPAH